MPVQSSGPISLNDINLEFARGSGAQVSMSQLYRGGGIVPNATVNQNIPTSGAISLSQFYGATRRVAINITISSNQTNYVLNTAKAAGYVAGVSDVVLTINSGIYVSANSTGVYALDVDTSWAAGDTVQIVNNGFIIGMGGAGGAGGRALNSLSPAGSAGSAGGPALVARRAVSISNAGTIAGGGGGGGGGRGVQWYSSDGKSQFDGYAPGAGGGGGRSSAAANSTGGGVGATRTPTYTGATAGGGGTVSSPGGGGVGANSGPSYSYFSGPGGAGGQWGAAGGSGGNESGGTSSTYPSKFPQDGPYGGGAGGVAVAGNGNITWLATGTRLGSIT